MTSLCVTDRRAADAGDWRVGDKRQATVPGDQRCSDDACHYDHCRRKHVACHLGRRCRWRNQEQTPTTSTSQNRLFVVVLRNLSSPLGMLAERVICSACVDFFLFYFLIFPWIPIIPGSTGPIFIRYFVCGSLYRYSRDWLLCVITAVHGNRGHCVRHSSFNCNSSFRAPWKSKSLTAVSVVVGIVTLQIAPPPVVLSLTLVISAKWREYTGEIYCDAWFCPSFCEHSVFRCKYLENGFR